MLSLLLVPITPCLNILAQRKAVGTDITKMNKITFCQVSILNTKINEGDQHIRQNVHQKL